MLGAPSRAAQRLSPCLQIHKVCWFVHTVVETPKRSQRTIAPSGISMRRAAGVPLHPLPACQESKPQSGSCPASYEARRFGVYTPTDLSLSYRRRKLRSRFARPVMFVASGLFKSLCTTLNRLGCRWLCCHWMLPPALCFAQVIDYEDRGAERSRTAVLIANERFLEETKTMNRQFVGFRPTFITALHTCPGVVSRAL